MSGRDQSDAIWIRQKEQNVPVGGKTSRQHSIDFGTSFHSRFNFGRSMSVNSEGASTTTSSSSPPYSPIDMSAPGGGKSSALNIPDPGGRFRTSSFSAGYGADRHGSGYGDSYERDPYLIHSPLSTSAPGRDSLFLRSNSISMGALENNHSKYDKKGANLGPIDEVGKMHNFGDALKRSMGQLFSTPKLAAPPKSRDLSSSVAPAKKKHAIQDRVVSMLCDGAMR